MRLNQSGSTRYRENVILRDVSRALREQTKTLVISLPHAVEDKQHPMPFQDLFFWLTEPHLVPAEWSRCWPQSARNHPVRLRNLQGSGQTECLAETAIEPSNHSGLSARRVHIARGTQLVAYCDHDRSSPPRLPSQTRRVGRTHHAKTLPPARIGYSPRTCRSHESPTVKAIAPK